MTHNPIPASHFNKRTLNRLAKRNIFVVGSQAIPDETCSFLNSQTGYLLSDNGTGRLVLFLDVLKLAEV